MIIIQIIHYFMIGLASIIVGIILIGIIIVEATKLIRGDNE